MAIQMNATAVNQAAQTHSTERRLDSDGGHKATAVRTTTQEEANARNEAAAKVKVVSQFTKVERTNRDEQQNSEEKKRRNQEDSQLTKKRGQNLDFII